MKGTVAPPSSNSTAAHLLLPYFDFCGQLPNDLLHVWANSLILKRTKREAREFATGLSGA